MNTIITGAIYTNGNILLRPHYSGEFHTVDCTEYKSKEIIKQEYDKETAKQMLANSYLEYDGKRFYECEYGPHHVDSDFRLLSDLEFFDDETSF